MQTAEHRILHRALLATAGLLIVVAACGGSMSENEYVERLNDLVATLGPELDASLATYGQISDPTMADWAAFIDREVAIRLKFVEGFEAMDPPDSITDVHQILGDALDRGLVSAQSLATVAETASSPAEAEQTPEFAEYLAANEDGSSRVCLEAQAKLDELAASGEVFSDVPWFPGELTETVRVAFGCLEAADG